MSRFICHDSWSKPPQHGRLGLQEVQLGNALYCESNSPPRLTLSTAHSGAGKRHPGVRAHT